MFSFGFSINKTLFIIALIADIIYLLISYFMTVLKDRKIILMILMIIIAILKYPFYTVSYKYISKKLLFFALVSVILSHFYELFIGISMFYKMIDGSLLKQLYFFFVPITVLICLPFFFITKIIFIINLFLLNKLVKGDMVISVSTIDGSYKKKIDKWADILVPGL